MIMTFTRFDIPIARDRYGSTTMKAVVVSDELLPVMADIIEKATRSVLLTQERTIRVAPEMCTEESLAHIRKSVAKELTYALEDHAKEHGLAIITKPDFEESIDGGVLAFRATATAMRLLEKGLRG
jgi:hypothetical protein